MTLENFRAEMADAKSNQLCAIEAASAEVLIRFTHPDGSQPWPQFFGEIQIRSLVRSCHCSLSNGKNINRAGNDYVQLWFECSYNDQLDNDPFPISGFDLDIPVKACTYSTGKEFYEKWHNQQFWEIEEDGDWSFLFCDSDDNETTVQVVDDLSLIQPN